MGDEGRGTAGCEAVIEDIISTEFHRMTRIMKGVEGGMDIVNCKLRGRDLGE